MGGYLRLVTGTWLKRGEVNPVWSFDWLDNINGSFLVAQGSVRSLRGASNINFGYEDQKGSS